MSIKRKQQIGFKPLPGISASLTSPDAFKSPGKYPSFKPLPGISASLTADAMQAVLRLDGFKPLPGISASLVTAQACVRLALACNEELTIVARNAFTG